MGLTADQDVVFDFAGSLALARRLWALADEVDQLLANRVELARTALDGWLGAFADEFVSRVDTEQAAGAQIGDGLRGDAAGWATAWKDAMDQQNRVLYAREYRRVERERGGWDAFWGGIVGHDDLPSEPSPARIPQPPQFATTRGFVRY